MPRLASTVYADKPNFDSVVWYDAVVPDRSSKRKRPTDLNQLAASIVADATADDVPVEQPAQPAKDPAAVSLGRRGGLKGGKARAAKLSPEERREIARKAAAARWRTSPE